MRNKVTISTINKYVLDNEYYKFAEQNGYSFSVQHTRDIYEANGLFNDDCFIAVYSINKIGSEKHLEILNMHNVANSERFDKKAYNSIKSKLKKELNNLDVDKTIPLNVSCPTKYNYMKEDFYNYGKINYDINIHSLVEDVINIK